MMDGIPTGLPGLALAAKVVQRSRRAGFEPALDVNTPTAKLAIACLYSVIPAGLALVAVPLLWRYPLTRERQLEIRTAIDEAQLSAGS